ncbi:hypothetical protein SPBR_08698 [Sporothrix brasiliensis 5110]|uniref:Uncharacterized protein n=1 Tax=Sporothrix brasiliensis 5110 TaxID=1398154 RepID=A0A0C2IAZ5_9PEZI|nr:uncharacterized protein SPBR_08698 [Sporothrix brasiliensis 5110]KIH86421.1 hypothetical protein SPBR_08698 [Sporothrix brasiliensis 5110]
MLTCGQTGTPRGGEDGRPGGLPPPLYAQLMLHWLGLHAPRREILVKTNDSGVAIGQVLKFAGQRNPKVLLHHYLDDMSTIDGAAIFLGTNPRKDLTQDFRSATMKRNAQLPQTLPSEVKAALESQQEYARLSDKLERLAPERGTAAEAQRKQLNNERRKIVLTALKDYQMSQVQAYPTKTKEQRRCRCG